MSRHDVDPPVAMRSDADVERGVLLPGVLFTPDTSARGLGAAVEVVVREGVVDEPELSGVRLHRRHQRVARITAAVGPGTDESHTKK